MVLRMLETPVSVATNVTSTTTLDISRQSRTFKPVLLKGAWFTMAAAQAPTVHASLMFFVPRRTGDSEARHILLDEGWLRSHQPATTTTVTDPDLPADSLYWEGEIPCIDEIGLPGTETTWRVAVVVMNISGVTAVGTLRALIDDGAPYGK